MKRKALLLIIMLCACSGAFAASIGRHAYGVYSETFPGIVYKSTVAPDGGVMMLWGDGNVSISDDITVSTEGTRSLKALAIGAGGWWTQFGSTTSSRQTDMRDYAGGTVEFMIKNTIPVTFKLEWGTSGSDETVLPANDTWHKVSLPFSSFSGIDLSVITVPAGFHVATAGLYWVDNIVWKTAATGSLSAGLHNISGGTANAISWSNVKLGSTTWKCADQYIELDLDYQTAGWGIQIYTDNKNAKAQPRFTGAGDPSGLVCVSTTTKRLPMSWRIVDVSTNTLSIVQGASGYPYRLWSKELSEQYPCFVWMKDRSTSTFADGQDYCTVWDNRGIQHAESTWGGAVSPNYIYLGADFTNAVTPETYTSNMVIVELFHE